jgi:hypothetical protein
MWRHVVQYKLAAYFFCLLAWLKMSLRNVFEHSPDYTALNSTDISLDVHLCENHKTNTDSMILLERLVSITTGMYKKITLVHAYISVTVYHSKKNASNKTCREKQNTFYVLYFLSMSVLIFATEVIKGPEFVKLRVSCSSYFIYSNKAAY